MSRDLDHPRAPVGRPRPSLASVRETPAWRFVASADLANFASLRRLVGRARADMLVVDTEARLREVVDAACDQARIHIVARSTVEIEWRGASIGELHAMLDAIDAAFRLPFDLDGEPHTIELLLAAAAGPAGAIEDVRLAEEADEALAQARTEHRRVVRNLAKSVMAVDKLALRRELPAAIANGEMFLQYQPKVHVRRQAITSAEALVRWHHPSRGLIQPGDFIALTEEARLIDALTLWTIRQVIVDQAVMREDGHDLTIFVNISGQLLGDRHFLDRACAMIRTSAARIGFEITETSMIRDPDTAIANLVQIAEQGIPIAIDDYGAGLSSLAYLKRLPASELKIDKMFVMELTSSNRDPLIVRSTIDLAHAMEMEVTAEGVETPAALALLSVMGCDMVQGFLISRPLSIDPFRRYMRDQAGQAIEAAQASLRRPASFWKSA